MHESGLVVPITRPSKVLNSYLGLPFVELGRRRVLYAVMYSCFIMFFLSFMLLPLNGTELPLKGVLIDCEGKPSTPKARPVKGRLVVSYALGFSLL